MCKESISNFRTLQGSSSLQGHKPHSWKLLLFSCSVVSDSLSAPGTVACQDPLSMGFPKEYWSGLPFPPPGYALHPRIEPKSPSWEVDSLLLGSPGKPFIKIPKHGLPFHPHSRRRVQWGFSRGYKLCDITTVWMQKQRIQLTFTVPDIKTKLLFSFISSEKKSY